MQCRARFAMVSERHQKRLLTAAKLAERRSANTRSNHLSACPFCGIEPGGVFTLSKGEKSVGCYCGAMGPVALTDADAIDNWNQRVHVISSGGK
jgi:Lar family restriction alleviation protein